MKIKFIEHRPNTEFIISGKSYFGFMFNALDVKPGDEIKVDGTYWIVSASAIRPSHWAPVLFALLPSPALKRHLE